jgi:hypothetical protein
LEQQSYAVAPGAVWKELDGSIVVVNTVTGAYYSLNESALTIWQDIIAGKTGREAAEHLAQIYAADCAVIANDVQECLDFWLKEDLLVEAAAPRETSGECSTVTGKE